MNTVMWPLGKDHPDCICGENPNTNCPVHITKMPDMTSKTSDPQKVPDEMHHVNDNTQGGRWHSSTAPKKSEVTHVDTRKPQKVPAELKVITLNGAKYYQHCTDPNHNCYLRPMPTVIKGVKVSDLLKSGSGGSLRLSDAPKSSTQSSRN